MHKLLNAAVRVRDVFRVNWYRYRFGKITQTIKSFDGGIASEIEFTDKRGKVIGYWSRGSYDPKLPFKGY